MKNKKKREERKKNQKRITSCKGRENLLTKIINLEFRTGQIRIPDVCLAERVIFSSWRLYFLVPSFG